MCNIYCEKNDELFEKEKVVIFSFVEKKMRTANWDLRERKNGR